MAGSNELLSLRELLKTALRLHPNFLLEKNFANILDVFSLSTYRFTKIAN